MICIVFVGAAGAPVAARELQHDGAGPARRDPLGDPPDEHLRVEVLEDERGVDEVVAPRGRAELLRLGAEQLELGAEVHEPLARDAEVLEVHVDAGHAAA